MATSVNADLTVTINVTDQDTSHTSASGGDTISLQETAQTYYTAGTAPTVAKSWSSDLSLAATPTTLDLTSLSGPRGSTVTFASLRLVYIRVTDTTAGHSVTVGNAASNVWYGPLNASTDTYAIPANSRVLFENADTPWTVDGTHKSLKLDPGANTVTVRVILVGS